MVFYNRIAIEPCPICFMPSSGLELDAELALLNYQKLADPSTDNAARVWWREFLLRHGSEVDVNLLISRVLIERQITITAIYEADLASGSNSIADTIAYLDVQIVHDPKWPSEIEIQKNEPMVLRPGSEGIRVCLDCFGERKVLVVKAVRDLTHLSLMDAKALVESAPVQIGCCKTVHTMMKTKTIFEKAGAKVRFMDFRKPPVSSN